MSGPWEQYATVSADSKPWERYTSTSEPVVEKKPERSLMQEIGRQMGLTARYGIEGVGGILALPGTLADAATGLVDKAHILPQKLPKFNSMSAVSRVADALGLPQPEGAQERVVGDVTRAMAGVGGMGQAARVLAPMGGAVSGPVLETLARNPAAQQASAIGGSAAGGVAREEGAGPMGQLAATLAGSVAAPVGVNAANWVGKQISDAGATVGASFGNQRGIDRIARDAAQRVAGDSRDKIVLAIKNRTDSIPDSKSTVAEAISEAQIGKPEQFGGATVKLQKDLTGAKGIEDVLTGTAREQRVARGDYKKAIEATYGPERDRILADINSRGGVPAQAVIDRISSLRAEKGIPDVADVALKKIQGKILKKVDENTGMINADDLYTKRKEIGLAIQSASKKTNNWDKQVTGKIERDVQIAIDDAIESAGGKDWRSGYMEPYAAGRKEIGNAILRQKEAKDIGASVKGTNATELSAGEIPRPPTLLSRPMMALNFGLRMISRDANTPVARELAKRMQNPDEYAKLLALDPKNPLRQQAEQIARTAAIVGASQQQGEQ